MEWVKAGHVISVIAWMAALLYLPRLFVYHADCGADDPRSETFKIMERRLYHGIMTPAMIGTWIFGLWMAFGFQTVAWDISQGWGWVWAKAVLVVLLTGFHGFLGRHRRNFANDRNLKSSRYFRFINEVPTLLMIFIVVLVIVRPF
jgi:putative membrane protein